jgi:hypothetical protein
MAGLKSIGALGTIGPKSPPGLVPHAPPPAKTAGRPLPNPGRFTTAPQGPELLRLGQKRSTGSGGPGVKPATFLGSGAEWVWFWATWKYHNEPGDPRNGPFTGGVKGDWAFQVPENPLMPREAASTVSDFVYTMPGGRHVIVRIEGFYWHIGFGAAQQARDLYLINQAGSGGDRVERVNDADFMGDETGSTAIRLLADILAGRPRTGALAGGTAKPPRYAKALGGTA